MPRIHGRMVRQIRDGDSRRVSGVLGRRGIVRGVVVGGQVVIVDNGSRDLKRETRESLGGPLHGRLRGVGWEGVFTLQTKLERPAATGPTHHLLRSHCTICPDVACADALLAVGEDKGLSEKGWISIWIKDCGRPRKRGHVLTARMFTTLMTMARIPAEITIRQNASPSDFWLMAAMFRLPSTATPMIIMTAASVMKPASSPNRGQLRVK